MNKIPPPGIPQGTASGRLKAVAGESERGW